MNRWLCVKLIQSAGCLKVKQTWFQNVKIVGQVLPAASPTWCCTRSPPRQEGSVPRATSLPCCQQCPEVLCRAARWCRATTALLLVFGTASLPQAGHAVVCSTMLKWDILTFEHHACLSNFPYCHIFLPFGSGYHPQQLHRVGSITFLVPTFTWQVYRGPRLAELVWRQWLVPRSQGIWQKCFPTQEEPVSSSTEATWGTLLPIQHEFAFSSESITTCLLLPRKKEL